MILRYLEQCLSHPSKYHLVFHYGSCKENQHFVIECFKGFLTTSLLEAIAQRFSVKSVFLEISQNSQENTSARKKRLWHRCFPVNFAKFLRTHFLTEHLRWLLLFFYFPLILRLTHVLEFT